MPGNFGKAMIFERKQRKGKVKLIRKTKKHLNFSLTIYIRKHERKLSVLFRKDRHVQIISDCSLMFFGKL